MYLSDVNLERITTLPRAPAVAGARHASAPRSAFLTAEGQAATPLENEVSLGENDLVEANFIDKCRIVRECVGRITVRGDGRRGKATGFLVAPGVLLTNHHVLPTADTAVASTVDFGYWFDVAGQPPSVVDQYGFDPGTLYVSDEALDFAIVALRAEPGASGDPRRRGHLRLIPGTGKVKEGEFVTILQHPEGEPMRVALRENQVTRVDPDEDILWYAADTAYGSSGAPVFNNSLQLVALHSGGRIKRNEQGQFQLAKGGYVDTVDGLTEADVAWEANVGTRVSRICEAALRLAQRDFPGSVAALKAAMAGGDVLSVAVGEAKGRRLVPASGIRREILADAPSDGAVAAGARVPQAAPASGTLTVPLELSVSLSAPGRAQASVAATSVARLEREASRLQMPVIYDALEDRDGFLPGFLELDDGSNVPMPAITASGEKVLAPLLDRSGTELRYNHFSVWMHRTRRLALMTASMVDWTARSKKIDGKSTDRDTLNGFPKNSDIPELWAEDPRVASEHQLPDVFFTEDRKAFDKGHIVRRDDVCWGSTFEEIQMANGDTFHTTNCSPQTKPFNQAVHGRDNWGDLEVEIEKVTRKDGQRASIFAGPVFGRDDRWFHGVGETGSLRVQIPSRYWKVVVVKGEQGPEAYGFLLKQDVRSVTEREFFVGREWLNELKPLPEIQETLRGWIDLSPLLPFDCHGDVEVRD